MRTAAYIFLIATIFSCSSRKNLSAKAIRGEVLVDLANGVEPSAMASKFKAYDLTLTKMLSLDLNIVLYTFDKSKISTSALISALVKNEGVENAQTNKNTKVRKTR
jgi:hypothetical protein